MNYMASSRDYSADERHTAHNEYLKEFLSGAISGKEYVERLQNVCGFSQFEARREWQMVVEETKPAVYLLKGGDLVSVPVNPTNKPTRWLTARITSFYGSGVGVIVELIDGDAKLRLPFAMYEVRSIT